MIDKKTKVYINNDIASKCEESSDLFSRAVRFLKNNNYELTNNIDEADVSLINSCTVMNPQIQASRNAISNSTKKSNIKKTIFFGCGTATIKDFKNNETVEHVKPKELKKLNDLFSHNVELEEGGAYKLDEDIFNNKFHDKVFDQDGIENAEKDIFRQINGKDVYIHISQGCNHACDFCAIKNAKGGVQSKPIDTIINDIITYIQKNKQQSLYQFVLQSDDCGGYGLDIGTSFSKLVEEIKKINKNIKLKCSNIHPEDLARIWPELKKNIGMFSFMNIPLEHGSNRIIKLMKRYYTVEDTVKILNEIRELSPNTWLYCQMIINYPTETREEFLELLEASRNYDEVVFHGYSEVEGKKSAKLYPKVWNEEKIWRNNAVNEFIQNKEVKAGVLINQNDNLDFLKDYGDVIGQDIKFANNQHKKM